jgi:hypothetical protein
MSDSDFAMQLAELVASLNDAPTQVVVPKPAVPHHFPLGLARVGGRILVADSYERNTAGIKGAQLLSINGRPAQELWEGIERVTSGERKAWIDHRVANEFPFMLPVLHVYAPFRVALRTDLGETKTLVLPGVSYEELQTAVQTKRQNVPYRFEVLQPEDIGLIEYNSCEDLDRFRQFLHTAFGSFRKANVRVLIIDIRNNSGGNSELNTLLVNYLTVKPWRDFSQRTKISPELKAWWREGIYKSGLITVDEGTRKMIAAHYKEIADLPDGSIQSSEGELITPPPNDLRFSGHVYLLIGVNTFSSGADLAAQIADNGVGELVGEETGGLASTFGDIYEFSLPNSKIRVDVSQSQYIRPSGKDDAHGILPTYEVKEAAGGQQDEILKFVKALIAKRDALQRKSLQSH